MTTPREFISRFIDAHEGGLSLHPDDNGNWFDPIRYKTGLPQRRNKGTLVGSKYGVTAYALANYRGVSNITAADMRNLTHDEAVNIGVELYFNRPGFSKLPWNRVTMSVVDKGWGSGPGTAIRILQRLIGVPADGAIGPMTVNAYNKWLNSYGEEGSAFRWGDARIAFDHGLAVNEGANDPDKVFENGWNNRTRSFLPGTSWWKANG
ncbi:MAG: glycoside hydrolase family 108 protein [Sphingomonas sp.]|uniref:glycoside hydrolase family 108 protein n=1 Tax=Sphingomonas sp. TaxID=28214 RepID=UPI003F802EE6